MDQETKEKTIIESSGSPEAAPKAKKKASKSFRRALRRAYMKTAPARKKLVEGRNGFCRAIRGAFDSVAAFGLKIWAVIGPICRNIGHGVAVAAKAVWKVIGPALKKLWSLIRPGFVFLGSKVKAGASYVAGRFKG
ncbi:MAG: hypothetical protein IJH54_00055, partial [Clostridia bacterium]|nr:hypothetical protein [Clostridia bacterium]